MKDSGFGHLIGVLIHPTKSFRSIAERPSWWQPVVAMLPVGIAFIALMIAKIDWPATIRDRYEGRGQEISAEELAAITETLESGCVLWLAVPVVLLVVFPVMASLFHLALKAFGSEMSFRQGFAVTLYGLLPSWVLSGLLTIPVLMSKSKINPAEMEGRDLLWSNPAFLAGDEASLALLAFLSSLDVFSFWSLALLTIGFSIAGRVSKGQAATCVVGIWVLYVAVKVGFGAIGIDL